MNYEIPQTIGTLFITLLLFGGFVTIGVGLELNKLKVSIPGSLAFTIGAVLTAAVGLTGSEPNPSTQVFGSAFVVISIISFIFLAALIGYAVGRRRKK